jgi:hypothetical protein
MFEGLALQVLQADEVLAIGFIDVINRANVGMVQSRGGLGLALGAFQSLPVPRQFLRQKLQCNGTLEPSVFRLVDHSHPATTQLLQDSIMRNCFADLEPILTSSW